MMTTLETWLFISALILCIGYLFFLLYMEARWIRSRKYMIIKRIGNRQHDNFWR